MRRQLTPPHVHPSVLGKKLLGSRVGTFLRYKKRLHHRHNRAKMLPIRIPGIHFLPGILFSSRALLEPVLCVTTDRGIFLFILFSIHLLYSPFLLLLSPSRTQIRGYIVEGSSPLFSLQQVPCNFTAKSVQRSLLSLMAMIQCVRERQQQQHAAS